MLTNNVLHEEFPKPTVVRSTHNDPLEEHVGQPFCLLFSRGATGSGRLVRGTLRRRASSCSACAAVELLTALDPHQLDPDRSSAADTHEGSVLATLRHRSEDLLEIIIDCSADGFASISSPALGAPEEIYEGKGHTVDDWCADVLDSVTDALLQRYTLTDYTRDGRLLRTRLTSDSQETAGSMIVAGSWRGLSPLRRRDVDVTIREAGYDCRGSLPSALLRSAVFVIDAQGLVRVFRHMRFADAALEAVDAPTSEKTSAFDEHGVRYRLERDRGGRRLVPTGKVDPQGLIAALRAWPDGPVHLAGDPHAYAVRQLANP